MTQRSQTVLRDSDRPYSGNVGVKNSFVEEPLLPDHDFEDPQRPTHQDKKIISGFAGGLALTAVNVMVSFLQLRILLHHLSPESAGIWMLFLTFGNYVLFFDLGLSPTLGREISFSAGSHELSAMDRARRIGSLVRSCTRVVCGLAVVIYLLANTVAWDYLTTIVPVSMLSQAHKAWFIFAAGAALNLVGEGWFAGIYGLGQVFTEKLIRAAGLAVGFIMMLAALMLGFQLKALAATWLCQCVITILLARLALYRVLPAGSDTGKFESGIVKQMAGPSLKYAATMLGGILILQTDNLVIASLFGARAIPNYQAVAKLVTTLMSLSMMLVVTTAPFVSHAYARGDEAEIRRLLGRNLRMSLTVMTVLGSFLACFADRIVSVWLGPGHFVGFGVVWVLLGIMLLEAHHLGIASATMACGKIVFAIPALIAGGLNIAFSIVLGRHLSLVGVALGTMCAQVLTNNWYVPYYGLHLFRVSFREHLRRVVLPVVSLLLLLLSLGWIIRGMTSDLPALVSVMVGCSMTLLLGGSAALLVVFTKDERGQAWLQWKRRIGGAG